MYMEGGVRSWVPKPLGEVMGSKAIGSITYQ